jgi:hypothetical protein
MKKLNLLWKNNFKILSIFFLLTLSACQTPNFLQQKPIEQISSEIITINSIEDVIKFANKDSLIIFDIDHTLLKEYLVNKENKILHIDSCLYNLIDQYIVKFNTDKVISDKNLKDNKETRRKLKSLILPFTNLKMVEIWEKVEPQIKYELTETNIPQILSILHNKEIKTIAFTAREYDLQDSTLEELKAVNINLNKIPLYKNQILEKPKSLQYGYGYKDGVISLIRGKDFTEKTQKGRILIEFFKKINFKPNNIIFIDNRLDNVTDVFNVLNSENIKTIGLFYNNIKSDKKRTITKKEINFIASIAGNNWWHTDVDLKKLKLL